MRTAGGYEVDFHVRHLDGHEELIQVCASVDHPDTYARELRALQDAATEYAQASRVLITLDKPTLLDIPSGVTVVAARDWLLTK